MAWNSCKVSAPGSVMILGEHAVLHGSRSIVCAVNHRMTFFATPLEDHLLTIQSDLGEYESPLSALKEDHTFRFILEAFNGLTSEQGVELRVESDMSHQVGLGTSAAVTACACALRAHIEKESTDPADILPKAVELIRSVQGSGSGSDAAASIFGGCVVYNQDSFAVNPIPLNSELALIYTGYKTPTPDVLKTVNAWTKEHPDQARDLYSTMSEIVEEVARGKASFVEAVRQYQQCMEELGVCDEALTDVLQQLSQQPNIEAAKISGSGLGDCVIAFGDAQASIDGYTTIEIAIDPTGLTLESI